MSTQLPTAPTAPAAPAKLTNISKWFKGLLCGSLSFVTCCCCCACGGHLKAPAVLYDYDGQPDGQPASVPYDRLATHEKRMINTVQWCGLAGLAAKCVPMACGCCCGCCGNVSPTEAALCIGAMEETKKKRH